MKQKVALIDDSEMFRTQMARLLDSEGFAVVQYDGAEAFLADSASRSADLIFLDVDLPGISGFEFIGILRERGFLVDTPLILISGTTDEGGFGVLRRYVDDDRVLAIEYYSKDRFSFDMLFLRMHNLFRMRSLYRALRELKTVT